MNKPKFTPGPWRVVGSHKSIIPLYVGQKDGTCICIPAMHDEISHNAQLIARAPEMYDLLHRIATHKGDDLGLFAHEAAQLIKELNQ